MNLDTLIFRIEERLRLSGLSERRACLEAGLKVDAIRQIRRGYAPKIATITALAEVLKTPRTYFMDDEPGAVPPKATKDTSIEFAGESYASVAVYEAAVSAGPGSLNADHATPLAYNLFRRDWLRSVTRVPVENLAILKVHGDSMTPTLLSGDDVLVDMSIKHIGRDGLYVLAADHEVQVKRVSRSPLDKSLSISSDNPAAQSWAGVSDENVFVLGRVIWLGRTI